MGKTSSTTAANYPSYSSGSVSFNGVKKATVSKNGNDINSNYNMNDNEKQMYDYAQNSLAESLPTVNVFDSDTNKFIQRQVDVYKQKALKSLDDLYSPMLKNLQNDISSRFGSFDNSMFMDKLNSLEDYRKTAASELAQDVTTYQSDLFNNELVNRYNYLNLLNNLINGTQDNAMDYISSALNNANSGNSYNMAKYNAELRNAMNGVNTTSSTIGSMAKTASLAKMFGLL